MIVLFDTNIYDKLIELYPKNLQKILNKIEKVIIPQAVKNQLDMMIGNKDEKLLKINQIICELKKDGKIEEIAGMFCLADYSDFENGKLKKDKKTSKKYYTAASFSTYETFHNKSLGINTYQKQCYFDSLPGSMKNGDKEIALSAKQANAALITNDKDCIKALIFLGKAVYNLDELLIKLL